MRKFKKLIKSFYQLFLPVIVLVILTVVIGGVLLVHNLSKPSKTSHLVTPEKFAKVSAHGAQITDETWENKDGSTARGWILRGSPGSPAVILLHRYGTDRSHVLNLGVKLSEGTNFTVVMPDQRGHGENPPVANSSFGGSEVEDTLAIIDFLKKLKVDGKPLVGKEIGIYGIELGALVGLSVADKESSVKVLALDSVPKSSNDLLANVLEKRFSFASSVTSELAKIGTRLYFLGRTYERAVACDMAKNVSKRQVMLLAGADAPSFQTSTSNLKSCFPKSSKVKSITDLSVSGHNLIAASLEKADFYDQRIIYFFKENLEGVESSEATKEESKKEDKDKEKNDDKED